MSASQHAQAYIRSEPPHHPLMRKTTASAPRLSRPQSKSIPRSKLLLKPTAGKKVLPPNEEDIVVDEEDETMSSSFLQYCAMCENQIVVPNTSILYCSESDSCRRKDGCTPPISSSHLSLYNPSSPNPSTPRDEAEDILGLKARNISLSQLPTVRSISTRIPSMAHDGKSDLDPSEWKPQLPRTRISEAFQYLSQFHCSATSLTPIRRPVLSTTASVTTTAPSLSHTPTTSSSSSESLATTPHEFRPLLPRHDPTYSASAGTRSIDLIVPHLHSAFSVPVNSTSADIKRPSSTDKCEPEIVDETEEEDFGKRWVADNPRPAVAGSLTKLLEIDPSGHVVAEI